MDTAPIDTAPIAGEVVCRYNNAEFTNPKIPDMRAGSAWCLCLMAAIPSIANCRFLQVFSCIDFSIHEFIELTLTLVCSLDIHSD